MKLLLIAKPWQIFILLITGLFLSNINIGNDFIISSVLKVIGLSFCYLYPFTMATYLYKRLPKNIDLNYNFYLINVFLLFTTFSLVAILSDEGKLSVSGILAIPALYIVFALLHFCIFPVKILKSIELNKEADWKEYSGDFIMLLCLPIGVWFIQPRVKQIIERTELIQE